MVSEILVLMKNRNLLNLIIHGTEALLYTNKIYPTPYIILIRCSVVPQTDALFLKIQTHRFKHILIHFHAVLVSSQWVYNISCFHPCFFIKIKLCSYLLPKIGYYRPLTGVTRTICRSYLSILSGCIYHIMV